jgi:apolipoprotein N-acyltransferase
MSGTSRPLDGGVSKQVLFALTLASSILLPLALPNFVFNYGNPAIGIVCLVPLFVAVSLAPSFKFASLLGVIFGGLSTALTEFWLMFFQDFSIWTYGGVILGYIGYNSLLFPFLRGFSRVQPRVRPFVLAAAWAVYEFLKSIGFLGNPWGLVANPAGDILPLIQFIDVTGIWGLSFLMALINTIIAEWVLRAYRAAPPWNCLAASGAAAALPGASRRLSSLGLYGRQASYVLFLLLVVLAYGFARMAVPIPSHGTARLLLVQQNTDPWTEGRAVDDSTRINEELSAKAAAQSPEPFDLIVWSEGSAAKEIISRDNEILPENGSIERYARGIGTYTLFGVAVEVDRARRLYMNGAALVSPEGRIVETYGKTHPVPFAESIPFFEFKAVQLFFRNVIGIWLPWTTGNRLTIFRVPLGNGAELAFGAPICFEDAFSDLCRKYILAGGDMWINMTNDYWSKTVPSEVQHFQVAKFRAVENRRVLIRSTNGGVTAVVDPWGRTTASLPLFERRWLAVDVPIYKEKHFTVYTILGDYFPWCLAGILVVLLIGETFLGKKKPEA